MMKALANFRYWVSTDNLNRGFGDYRFRLGVVATYRGFVITLRVCPSMQRVKQVTCLHRRAAQLRLGSCWLQEATLPVPTPRVGQTDPPE